MDNIVKKQLKIQITRVDSNTDEVHQRPSRGMTHRKPMSLEEYINMMLDFVAGNDYKLPLKVQEIACKGRGVVATETIPKETFVVEYAGELISGKEARKIELQITDSKENVGNFMFFFKFKEKSLCIDASKESQRLGRLINHSKSKSNIRPIALLHQDVPRIVFVSTQIILQGEELLYDYGDQRKQSTYDFPFLKD